MLRPLLIALLLLDAGAAAAAAQADAYADPLARELVARARERRTLEDRRIQSYRTTATERISAGLKLGIGERLLYRRETASIVDWSRDTVRIHVVGASTPRSCFVSTARSSVIPSRQEVRSTTALRAVTRR
jgi:hypothetical protein